MANCKKCNSKLSFLGKCETCQFEANKMAEDAYNLKLSEMEEERRNEIAKEKQIEAAIQSVIMTTETFTNLGSRLITSK